MELFAVLNLIGLSASVLAIIASLLTKIHGLRKETKLTITIGKKKFDATIKNKGDLDRLIDIIQKASPTEKSDTSPSVGANHD